MSIVNDKEKQLVRQLKYWFNRDGMILYLGQNSYKELTKEITDLPWNCIFTSLCSEDLADLFARVKGRLPINIIAADTPREKLMNRSELSVIRLNGVGIKEDNFSIKQRAQRNHMLSWLSYLVGNGFNHLIIIGYDASNVDEPQTSEMYTVLNKLPKDSVRFFGIPEEKLNEEELPQALIEDKIALSCEIPLGDILSKAEMIQEQDEIIYEIKETDKIIYADGKPVYMPKEWVDECGKFAYVLNEEDVNGTVIYGREQQAEAFYQFLKKSATEWPQWYGYNRKHDFHVKREYEDLLYSIVKTQLGDIHIEGRHVDRDKSILLCGHPGSSKSITLGAIAHRIFLENKHPIVYIKNADLTFSQNSSTYKRLSSMLQKLEAAGSEEQKVLLIWDCSSYNPTYRAEELYNNLVNDGRKVVLLSTAYEQAEEFYNTCKNSNLVLDGDHLRFVRKTEGKESVLICENFYVIKARRELSEKEDIKLKLLCSEHTGYDKDRLNIWWKTLNDTNIFTRLYSLLYCLHAPLESMLRLEYKSALESGDLPEEIVLEYQTSMARALQESGIVSEADMPKVSLDYRKANTCIALFSRFKLEVTPWIALNMLNKKMNGNYKMIRKIMAALPWLEFVPSKREGNEDNLVFTYRTPLEAEIFLHNNEITEEEQVNCLQDLLYMVGETYRSDGIICSDEIREVSKLIRIIGPNTPNLEYRPGGRLNSEHLRFIDLYPRIIETLKVLRTVYHLEDRELISNEVTLAREYYGNDSFCKDGLDSIEFTQHRLQALSEAFELAKYYAEKMEAKADFGRVYGTQKQYYLSSADSLLVEEVFCDYGIRKLYGDIKDKGTIQLRDFPNLAEITLHFRDVFPRLAEAIRRNPSNGYFYNAMLRLFISENKMINARDKKVALTQIWQVVDELEGNPTIELEKKREYNALVTEIIAIADEINKRENVSINNIDILISKGIQTDFIQHFNEKLQQNEPCMILYLAQQELRRNSISYRSILNSEQVKICETILEFLNRDSYKNIVEGDAACRYMKIQLQWLIWTRGNPVIPKEECQLLALTPLQWSQINHLCCEYNKDFPEESMSNRNITDFLQALSLAGIKQYKQADAILQEFASSRFHSQVRMKTWYIICDVNDETGASIPRKFTGEVVASPQIAGDLVGYISIHNVNIVSGTSGFRGNEVYFYTPNLGLSERPVAGTTFGDLELGMGFTKFSLHREAGRKRK